MFIRSTRRTAGPSISVLCRALLGLGLLIAGALPAVAGPPGDQVAILFQDDWRPAQGLPDVLSDGDARLYSEIFRVQEVGRWKTADKLIAKLQDRRLMGHLLAQRYLHPSAYRSRYKELLHWLDRYADHPDAGQIYKLALKRRPKNYRYPHKPVSHKSVYSGKVEQTVIDYQSSKRLSSSDRRRARRIKWQVRRNVLRARLSVSEGLVKSSQAKRVLDQAERDELYGYLASGWYYMGRMDRAYALAGPASRRSGGKAPMASWIGGLAAWRLGKLDAAAEHFEQLALSQFADDWNVTAGAYWAARTHLRLRRPEEMSRWLSIAAKSQRTFYGLLARRALGIEMSFDYRPHELTAGGMKALLSTAESRRALALVQVGQRYRAERELLRLRSWNDPEAVEALLAVAEQAKMPALSFKLAYRLSGATSHDLPDDKLEAALYPIPHWQPDGGFKVDRALVYALMRQESAFNPKAKSRDGARGLMQLMPATAGFMARKRFRGSRRNQLYDPGLNLQLGQRYVTFLLSDGQIRDNLFRLTTAYNGGPGNLKKWQRRIGPNDDPLLFIESIPAKETRIFIERVLTNLWIYRARLGQPSPSLDAAASGDWPRYAKLDGSGQEVARREQARREQD